MASQPGRNCHGVHSLLYYYLWRVWQGP